MVIASMTNTQLRWDISSMSTAISLPLFFSGRVANAHHALWVKGRRSYASYPWTFKSRRSWEKAAALRAGLVQHLADAVQQAGGRKGLFQ